MNGSKPADKKMHRVTLSSQLFNLVKDDILEGRIKPGSLISEEALAETYGVSRSPAREALSELERLGLATRSGKRDRIVTILNAVMIREKFELWWIVDVGRTYLASLASSEKDIALLQSYIENMAKALAGDQFDEYVEQVKKFHNKIRSSCVNEAVNEVADDCDIYLRWFQNLYDHNPEFSQSIIDEHIFILDAYRRRDFADLSESVRKHIERQRNRVIEHFLLEDTEKPATERSRKLLK